ncbi:MAG: hypothetical protein H0V81_08345 [Solirubrobacterales bacterium]|nr:hypothetical protein [Solirubrobacterales bacterium]
MDRKLDAGALLVAAASLLLAVSLFLDWFGVGGSAVTAWDAFEILDLVLLAAAAVAVAAAFGPLEDRLLVGAAGVALVVVASQLIQAPPAGQGADIEVGAWLALASAFGLVGGAALSSAEIAVTVDVQGRERRQRVAAVDRRGEQPDDPAELATTREPEPAPDETASSFDRFAPAADDTQATQAVDATPETPER